MAKPDAAAASANDAHQRAARLRILKCTLPIVAVFDKEQFTLDAVAKAAAPYLWPTHMEQYEPRAFPVMDGDTFSRPKGDAEHAYYFAIRRLKVYKSSSLVKVPGINEVLSTTTVTGIQVRYFFYFESEAGAGAHRNDLESTEFYLLVAGDDKDRAWVFLWKSFGAAHGLPWATNASNLVLASSARTSRWRGTPFACDKAQPCYYRPVLFIEEGKHATALDLDRDGHLTPLIDLNKSFREAWGVRDTLGANSRVPPKFAADDLVPRVDDSLWSPEGAIPAVGRTIGVVPAASSPACSEGASGDLSSLNKTYLNGLDASQRRSPGRAVKALGKLAGSKGLCASGKVEEATRTPGDRPFATGAFRWAGPETPYGDNGVFNSLHVAFRYDRGTWWSFVAPVAVSLPFMGGWIVPKVNQPAGHAANRSIELMLVSSSTRKFGWYMTVGSDRWTAWSSLKPSVVEAGIKIRAVPLREWAPLDHKPTGWILPSFRVGYRAQLANRGRASDHRIVLEAGVGAW